MNTEVALIPKNKFELVLLSHYLEVRNYMNETNRREKTITQNPSSSFESGLKSYRTT